jgi:hypothetical protein
MEYVPGRAWGSFCYRTGRCILIRIITVPGYCMLLLLLQSAACPTWRRATTRGGARNAWGRKGEREGGRRARGERRKISSKRRHGPRKGQKSRFSIPLQPESNCTIRDSTVDYSTRSFPGKQPDRSNQGKVLKFHFFWNRNFELTFSAKFNQILIIHGYRVTSLKK